MRGRQQPRPLASALVAALALALAALALAALAAVLAARARARASEGFMGLNGEGRAVMQLGSPACVARASDGGLHELPWLTAAPRGPDGGLPPAGLCVATREVLDAYGGCAVPGLPPDLAPHVSASRRRDVVPGVEACAVRVSPGLGGPALARLRDKVHGDVVRASAAYRGDMEAEGRRAEAALAAVRDSEAAKRAVLQAELERAKIDAAEAREKAAASRGEAEAARKAAAERRPAAAAAQEPQRPQSYPCTTAVGGSHKSLCASCERRQIDARTCRMVCTGCDAPEAGVWRRLGVEPPPNARYLKGGLDYGTSERCATLDADWVPATGRLSVTSSCQNAWADAGWP